MKRVGLKEQNDRIRAFAFEQDMKISKFYEDKSDDYQSATGYDQLRKDGMKRQFDLVIFESLYRFGITIADARNLLLNTFFHIGIHFVIIEDGIDSRNKDEASLAKYFTEKHWEIMGRKSWNARMKKDQQDGRFGTGNYGYLWRADKQVFVIDEEAAPVIREIYELFLQGMPTGMIREYLTARSIETPSAHLRRLSGIRRCKTTSEWDACAVKRILREERYVGMTERDGNYFPAIIASEVFCETRSRFKAFVPTERDVLLVAIKKKCSFIDPDRRLQISEKYNAGGIVKYISVAGNSRFRISREEILRQVTRAMRMEKRICKSVLERFKTPEPEEILKTMEDTYHLQAKSLFEFSVEAQKDNHRNYRRFRKGKMSERDYLEYHKTMLQEIKEISDEFSVLLSRLNYRRTQFKEENDWIQRFLNVDEESLTPEIVKEVIDSIVLREDGKVDIYLNTKGKEVFPKTWTTLLGGKHGKKK